MLERLGKDYQICLSAAQGSFLALFQTETGRTEPGACWGTPHGCIPTGSSLGGWMWMWMCASTAAAAAPFGRVLGARPRAGVATGWPLLLVVCIQHR